MNTHYLRFRNSKKGVTPVIATIILIAGTLVLALVVGAYTFGLFGSNVKTVTLSSGTLYAGTSGFTFALSNPGSSTNITSLTVTGIFNSSSSSVLKTFDVSSGGVSGCAAAGTCVANGITSFTAIPPASIATVTGAVYNYVINLKNGQSVSGSLIAQ